MRPDFDADLDRVLDLGFGRRMLSEMVRMGMVEIPVGDPIQTAYHLGMRQAAMDLDRRIKAISGDKWLLMQREMMNMDEDSDKEPRDAEP